MIKPCLAQIGQAGYFLLFIFYIQTSLLTVLKDYHYKFLKNWWYVINLSKITYLTIKFLYKKEFREWLYYNFGEQSQPSGHYANESNKQSFIFMAIFIYNIFLLLF